MRRIAAALLLALLCSSNAHASAVPELAFRFTVIGIDGTPPASGATTIQLGDLATKMNGRLPDFQPPRVAIANYLAAQAWPKYDVTCASAPCASGHLPVPSNVIPGPCSEYADPTTGYVSGGFDTARINCIIDNLPNNSTAWVPDGDYESRTTNPSIAITINSPNRQLECESNTGTTFWAFSSNTATGGCQDDVGSTTTRTCGGYTISIGATNQWTGTAVSWTSGFAFNSQSVGVASIPAGLAIGDWVLLRMGPNGGESCEFIDTLDGISPAGVEDRNRFNHYARVTDIQGTTITLDRKLPRDYSSTTCGAKTLQEIEPLENVGVVNCRLAMGGTDLSNHPDSVQTIGAFNKDPNLGMGSVTESWLVGLNFDTWDEDAWLIRGAFRNLFMSTWVQNGYGNEGNTDGLRTHWGTAQNAFVNTIGLTNCVSSKQETSGLLDIWAYGYYPAPLAGGGASGGSCFYRIDLFAHGRAHGPFLWEGNDFGNASIIGDHFWGRNWKWITIFLNRNSRFDGTDKSSINSARDRCDSYVGSDWRDDWTTIGGGCTVDEVNNPGDVAQWPTANNRNVIGNVAEAFINTPVPAGGSLTPITGSGIWDVDVFSDDNLFMKNRVLQANFFRASSAEPTTDFDGAFPGTNLFSLAPIAGWSADDVPGSLYRTEADGPPIFWCQEACDWDDVHSKMGAWGDDLSSGDASDNFSGGTCKSPAQILFEGGTCTPCGAGGAGC